MRRKLWLGIIALAILGSQFGIAVAVTEWRGETRVVEQNTISQQRFLTGGEAAAKAHRYFYDQLADIGQEGEVATLCDPEDFNGRTDTWIIKCAFYNGDTPAGGVRAAVNDQTGEVSELP